MEAFPIAKRLNELGYCAFVLNYCTGKHASEPNPMDDVAQAVRFILQHAGEFNIDAEGYAVMGFSAGGHLAASFGTESLGYARYNLLKPGAVILAYPVVTMGGKTHADSRKNLLRKKNINNQELIKKYSIEQQVTLHYPPSYEWQFDQDDTVPIENTQMLTEVLKANGIPLAYETFNGTLHGCGLGQERKAEDWLDRAVDFWNAQ